MNTQAVGEFIQDLALAFAQRNTMRDPFAVNLLRMFSRQANFVDAGKCR